LQLTELGHETILAPNLADALDALDRVSVDLAILDWHLRDQVATPLVEILRARGVPFIICTGSAIEELSGMLPTVPLVPKPFNTDQLVASVSRALMQH
jgi:DNA-binding response OmpR family regulator